MGKGDFMLFNGTMTMKFLPRIAPSDKRFGEGYAARTKGISKYFKQEYESLKNDLETPQYFRQRLMANYNYKGWSVEWAAYKAAKQTDFYAMLNSLTKHCNHITELGSGYGFNAYMLHFLNRTKAITGIDISEEKADTAINCYSKKEQLNFVCADVFEYDFTQSNAFIIHDFFFTASIDKQHVLLNKLTAQLSEDGVLCFIVKNDDAEKHFAAIKTTAKHFNFTAQQRLCGSKSKYSILTMSK
jgi:trans-aconitate methyltransferase